MGRDSTGVTFFDPCGLAWLGGDPHCGRAGSRSSVSELLYFFQLNMNLRGRVKFPTGGDDHD